MVERFGTGKSSFRTQLLFSIKIWTKSLRSTHFCLEIGSGSRSRDKGSKQSVFMKTCDVVVNSLVEDNPCMLCFHLSMSRKILNVVFFCMCKVIYDV